MASDIIHLESAAWSDRSSVAIDLVIFAGLRLHSQKVRTIHPAARSRRATARSRRRFEASLAVQYVLLLVGAR
jgi:hypothetical protein